MSAKTEADKIVPLIEEIFEAKWKDICGSRKCENTCVKYLLSLYLFNLGYRHSDISQVVMCDRSHVYYIVERATRIMRSRDNYYSYIKIKMKDAMERSGAKWSVLEKWL